MAEKALTTYDDDIMDVIPKVLMVMFGVVLLFAVSPITQYAQAQTYAQAYLGAVDSRVLNAIPTIRWINLVGGPPYVAWLAADFENKGPGKAYVGINTPGPWIEMESGGGGSINMAGANKRIEMIFYKANPGETAEIRVLGKY